MNADTQSTTKPSSSQWPPLILALFSLSGTPAIMLTWEPRGLFFLALPIDLACIGFGVVSIALAVASLKRTREHLALPVTSIILSTAALVALVLTLGVMYVLTVQ